MIKLSNPFVNLPGYNCFVCSPDNPIGLHLDFYLDDQTIKASWNPQDNYQGYPNVVHGGIQATLMDEVASWAVYAVLGTGGVTYRLDIHYKKPVLIDKGKINLTAKIIGQKGKIASIRTCLYDGANVLCSEGTVYYYTFPENIAQEKMNYPGKEAFYK